MTQDNLKNIKRHFFPFVTTFLSLKCLWTHLQFMRCLYLLWLLMCLFISTIFFLISIPPCFFFAFFFLTLPLSYRLNPDISSSLLLESAIAILSNKYNVSHICKSKVRIVKTNWYICIYYLIQYIQNIINSAYNQ